MNMMYEWLSPNGLLVVTNVDPVNPLRYGMEHLLDWHLNYRTGPELQRLKPFQASADDCVVRSDSTGVNVFLEVRKAYEEYSESPWNQPDFKSAFQANEKEVRINTGKIASILIIFLMPVGVTLDLFVYPKEWGRFLVLRLICSVLVGVVWVLHTTGFGQKHYKWLGLPIALLPALFLCMMIYYEEGPASPYYAGLNLIILSISVVVHWSTLESVIATGCILLFYFIACSFKGTMGHLPIIFNNVYFLVVTGIIVVTGNHFFNQLRFREFALHYELEKSRKALEASLAQLKGNEAQLVQSEKLASLGRMSAGMIHEINNPLNFTTTALFTLRKKGKFLPPEQQKDYAEILKDVEEGVGRVKTIVSRPAGVYPAGQ